MTAPRTVLITRPASDAGPLALKIEMRGHRTVVAPVLDIRFLDAPLDLAGVQALAFTSANGVRALRHALGDDLPRALPAFAVGRATAAQARAAGFARVETAGGDVESLAKAIAGALSPDGGAVVHIAGRERAGDLARALAAAGFDARRAVLYAAEPAAELPGEVIVALGEGRIDDVAIFSPRSARQFVMLIERAGLRGAAERLRLLALSPRVAEAARGISFASVVVAPRADEDALIELIGAADDGASTRTEMAETMPETADKKTAAAGGAGSAVPPIPPSPPRPKFDPSTRHVRTLSVAILAVAALALAVGIVAVLDPALRSRAVALIDSLGLGQAARVAPVATDKPAPREATAPAPAPASKVEAARIDELTRRLGVVERELAAHKAAPKPEARPADADALSLLALIAALDAGRPFAVHVEAARAALAAQGVATAERRASLEALAAYGARGVPTAPMLAARARALVSLARPAPAAVPMAAPSPALGLWARIKAELAGLVTIRRVEDGQGIPVPGGVGAPDVPAALSGAADRIAAGDMAAALAALGAVDRAALAPAAAAALGELIADGEARIKADHVAAGPLMAAPAPAR